MNGDGYQERKPRTLKAALESIQALHCLRASNPGSVSWFMEMHFLRVKDAFLQLAQRFHVD